MGLLENIGSDIGVEGDRHGRVQEEDMEMGDKEQNSLRNGLRDCLKSDQRSQFLSQSSTFSTCNDQFF